jgi:hypothetical protein
MACWRVGKRGKGTCVSGVLRGKGGPNFHPSHQLTCLHRLPRHAQTHLHARSLTRRSHCICLVGNALCSTLGLRRILHSLTPFDAGGGGGAYAYFG